MNQTIRKIETILTSQYDVSNYTDFIREIFPTVQIVAPDGFNKEFTNFSSHIEGSAHVGNYTDPDGKTIIIFAVQLKKESYVENSRSTQRSYAKKLMEVGNADAAIVAFYTEGDPKWRLSFVRLDYEITFENGKLNTTENMTPAKRYSYLVGQDEPCHTAISRFRRFIIDDPNAAQPTLDDLEEAFSVEKVTEEFFNLYCEKFHQLRESLEANPDFVIEAEQHNFTSTQFAKKLMGQIVFLYFLQKKGWLGVSAWPKEMNAKEYKNAFFARGAKSRELIPRVYVQVAEDKYKLSGRALNELSDDDETILASCVKGNAWGTGSKTFMRTLFDFSQRRQANFFDDFLEPLFYNALNVNRGEQGYAPALHCRIPFLSGGLFEPIDGYDWEHNDFAIPNSVFSNKDEKGDRDADGILDIFDRYNFTMSEDEPLEREVAIDPEMLGKVFENLLEVKDRKSKGAFYTPREIVHYMCQESLISYLIKETGLKEQDIRDFILLGDFLKDKDTAKDRRQGEHDMLISEEIYKIDHNGNVVVDRLKDIDNALANIRVADPAVGSGAFPLGMLNEIVRARQNISAYMAITMNSYQTRNMYNNERSPYYLKLQTIKNCIFAADVEPSAVDIAQLRLWLSLVIDDEINPEANSPLDGHKNPIPLPNLDCNIVCGNSLIDEFEGIKLINFNDAIDTSKSNQQQNMFQNAFDAILPSLLEAQDALFRCDDITKKQELKHTIESLKDELVKTQMTMDNTGKYERYLEARGEASRPFVLWQIDFARVFREKGGFDVVIGNPPYGLLNKKQNQNTSIISNEYEVACYKNSPLYKPAKGGMINIFRLFVCKSFDLLKSGGHLSLIFPMAYMCDLSAKGLREFTLNKNSIDYLEAFPERDDENRRVFRSAKMSVCILGASKIQCDGDTKFPMRINHDRYVNTSMPRTWMSKNDILTIDNKSLTIPLVLPEEFKILVKICDQAKRMKDFSKCYTGEIDLSLNKKYVRLDNSYAYMLRGAQVQRFYTTNAISQGDIFYLDEDSYLAENKSEKSRHHEKSRIVMQGITGVNEKYRLKMTLSDKGTYCANSVNYLIIDNNIYYFLGLCNSKVLNWFFAKLSTNSNVNGYEVDNLPIRIGKNVQVIELEKTVKALLDSPSNDALKEQLDSIIYDVYGLTADEQIIIEKQTL